MDAVEPFYALVVYPATPDGQARQADSLLGFARDAVRLLPGFLRARVLLSEDGEHIVTLSEWSDRESFQQFRQSDFGRAATTVVAGLHPQAYWLREHALVEAP